MTAPERQKLFKQTIAKLKKSCEFAKAMESETVTRGTALTLVQLTEDAQSDAAALLKELGGDTRPKL